MDNKHVHIKNMATFSKKKIVGILLYIIMPV